MLSLLKKKPEAAPQSQALPWHPNFRNYEKLPDIKVVRTAFFINIGAIVTVLLFAGYVGYGEYEVLSIERQVDETQARIDRDRPSSDKAITLFRLFKDDEKRLQEISDFTKARPSVSPVLIHLSQTLPKNMALTLFDMRDKGLTLRGVVRGAPEPGARIVSAYRDQLRRDKAVLELFEDVSVINMNKSPQDGRLNVELFLKFKEPPKDKKN